MTDRVAARVPADALRDLCMQILQEAQVAECDARLTADVLVAADLRGVASHGVAHLRRYVDGLRKGTIIARPDEKILSETPVTAAIDAAAGLGPPVSCRAMEMAIQKACALGAGFVTVRNSNHYGIAGYYAMMALPHDCIGLSMTNASSRVVPTFGRDALLGTNPIAVAAPAAAGHPFVLDMATSTVAQGKVEIADQLDRPIPAGWALDPDGLPATDSHRTLHDLKARAGGGLLPLGGEGETYGGHKGYGLAFWVEIFAALLSGSAFGNLTYPLGPGGKALPANVGHFFGAWRVDAFRPAEEFKAAMDELKQLAQSAPRAGGQDRIYIAGEKAFEAHERNLREGIPINATVLADLRSLAGELGIQIDLG